MCCPTMLAWWWTAVLVWPYTAGYSWNSRPAIWQKLALCSIPLPCSTWLLVSLVFVTMHLKFACCCWSPVLYIQSRLFRIRVGEKCEGITYRPHRILASFLEEKKKCWTPKLISCYVSEGQKAKFLPPHFFRSVSVQSRKRCLESSKTKYGYSAIICTCLFNVAALNGKVVSKA
jgi:hypothetical protein